MSSPDPLDDVFRSAMVNLLPLLETNYDTWYPSHVSREPHRRVQQLQSLLQNISDLFKNFVESNNSMITPWIPQSKDCDSHLIAHCQRLQIPTLHDKPCLILHELGQSSTGPFAQTSKDVTTDIFRARKGRVKDVILLNTSGSGKTRLVLEGLCREWGFYFTCKRNQDEVGSSDIQSIIRDGGYLQQQGLKVNLPTHLAELDDALRNNENLANRCFSAAMLSRILVLSLFLLTWRGRCVDVSLLKRQWLLLQLDASLLQPGTRTDDVFQDLTGILSTVENFQGLSNIGDSLLEACTWEIQTLDPLGSGALYCVVDEAQTGAESWGNSFRCHNMQKSRPALQAMLRNWRETYTRMSMIITGTSINRDLITEALSSTMGKQTQVHDGITYTGAWGDDTTIQNYLRKYIPEIYLKTSEGVELISRACYWLWGRPRFIATYVQLVIQNNFQSYHRLLSYTIKEISNFTPNDAESWEEPEPKLDIFTPKLSPFDYQRVPNVKGKLLDAITQLTYERFMGKKPYSIPIIDHELVQCGFARFPGHTVENPAIDEPLAYLAADIWLNSQEDLEDGRHDYWHDMIAYNNPDINGFECYAALLLADVFKDYTTLSDIFDLHEPRIDRALCNQKARLVSCWRDASEVKVAPFVYPLRNQTSGGRLTFGPQASSHTLGLRRGLDHTIDLDWLDCKDRSPFLFPMTGFGPDLIFRLLLQDSQKIITVALQVKHITRAANCTTPSFIRRTLQTVTPNFFWDAGKKPDLGVDHIPIDRKELCKQTKTILDRFEHRFCANAEGYHSVLRAFLIFPAVDNAEATEKILTTVKERRPKKTSNDTEVPDESDAEFPVADNADYHDVTMTDDTSTYLHKTSLDVDVKMKDSTPQKRRGIEIVDRDDDHGFGIIPATKLYRALGGRAEQALARRMGLAQLAVLEKKWRQEETEQKKESAPAHISRNNRHTPYPTRHSSKTHATPASMSPNEDTRRVRKTKLS